MAIEAPALREVERILQAAASRLGISLEPHALALLGRYAGRLLAWNRQINLSGAADAETLAADHLADALALVPHLPARGRCIDVGSGSGLPGIVLAIVRPDLRFVLLEPNQKRRAFLSGAARDLGLQNVTISSDRLAEHAVAHPAAYDFAVARAVLPLATWLAAGRPLVRTGGRVAGLAGATPPTPLPRGAQCIRYEAAAGPRTLILLTSD
jgi:16S rRNA (guanine527-N7)-methyltransferase